MDDMEKKFINLKAIIVALSCIIIVLTVVSISGCGYSLPEKDESGGIYTVSEEESEKLSAEYAAVVKRAKYYSDELSLSKEKIRSKLIEDDGYTKKEAAFAVENAGVNWFDNALIKAKTYKWTMDMSDSDIFYVLTDPYGEMFTENEAAYALRMMGGSP